MTHASPKRNAPKSKKASAKSDKAQKVAPPAFSVVASTPRIYTADEHGILLSQFDSEALRVIQQLRSGGYAAYIVGGSLRDLLCSQAPKDFDISTSATPEQVKSLFRRQCILIGKRFRLAHIRFGQKVIEVATFRSGETGDDQLIVRDNSWGTLEEDIARRDFTINAFCYDPFSEELLDYVGGYEDMQSKTLRMIGDPNLRFRQDPVRMIRLLKFQARLNFTPDEAIAKALDENRDEILKSSPARILEELCKMLESGASERFFQLLAQCGLLKLLQPQINHFLQNDSSGVLYHHLRAIDYFIGTKKMSFERPILFSCLLFPLLQDRIKKDYISQGRIPSQGEILQVVQDLMHSNLRNTITFPAKLRYQTAMILEMQYRLLTLEGNPLRYRRLVHQADAKLALQFLYIRSAFDRTLCEAYAQWVKIWKEERSQ